MDNVRRTQTSSDPHGFLQDYFSGLAQLLKAGSYESALVQTAELFVRTAAKGGTVMIFGNGGSAAIASHIAIDLTKNAGIPAQTFNDASEITCLANDYGYDHWTAHAIRLKAKENDCVVAISSSGLSSNIINGGKQARDMKLPIVGLSGMNADNPLRKLADIDIWVDSRSYNHVETIHQFLLMSVVDLIIGKSVYPASQVVEPARTSR